jgi:acyl-coenzyme A synthetase/AMP-(fatty) acid ligase
MRRFQPDPFGTYWLGNAAYCFAVFRNCMGCPVLQGYGLTETAACATLMQLDEYSTGRVGPPVQGVNIRYRYPVRQTAGLPVRIREKYRVAHRPDL